jgi:hypothetical protein
MTNKHGKKTADTLVFLESVIGQFSPSWECRDCIMLDVHEYFEKREVAYASFRVKEDKDDK